MTTLRVVPAFDEIEHGDLGLGLGLEATPIEQLALESGKEALGHRVVEAIAHRAHRGTHAHFLATQAEGNRGVLRALVGMMNDIAGTALPIGHLERLQDQFAPKMVLHRPANDATTEASITTARYRNPAQVGT